MQLTRVVVACERIARNTVRAHPCTFIHNVKRWLAVHRHNSNMRTPCTDTTATEFSSSLCRMVWRVQTVDCAYWYVVHLQHKRKMPTIGDARLHNRRADGTQKDCANV